MRIPGSNPVEPGEVDAVYRRLNPNPAGEDEPEASEGAGSDLDGSEGDKPTGPAGQRRGGPSEDQIRQTGRLISENRKLSERLAALEARLSGQPEPDDPLNKLAEESALDRNLLDQAITARARAIIMETLAPHLKVAEADQKLVEQYGQQYLNDLPDVQKWLEDNEAVKADVEEAKANRMPHLGRRLAYEAYLRSTGTARASARREHVTEARKHAGILGAGSRAVGQSSGKRRAPTREEVDSAMRDAREGNWNKFDSVIVAPLLPSDEELIRMFQK